MEPDPPLAIVVPGQRRFNRSGDDRISRACRLLVAEAERLAERLAPRAVVFTGGCRNGGPSEAEQMRDRWRGPEVELVLEPTAATTAENASRSLPLLLELGVGQAFVVCTPVHLYRARCFFRRLYEAHGVRTSFHAARVAPTPFALGWELAALTVRARQLRAAEAELEQTVRSR
jgi:uncharacterized SAM-binding protein YcdF (DUF218 family)